MPERISVYAFIGPSGSGKTTLIRQLIQHLAQQGYRVGALKHTDHEFEIDRPGKDSFVMREAGANPVVICSAHRLAVVQSHATEPTLEELAQRYFPDADVVLAEGFRGGAAPKIVVHRRDCGPIDLPDGMFALVTDDPATMSTTAGRTVFRPEEMVALAEFIVERRSS